MRQVEKVSDHHHAGLWPAKHFACLLQIDLSGKESEMCGSDVRILDKRFRLDRQEQEARAWARGLQANVKPHITGFRIYRGGRPVWATRFI